jgi:hypothetical protein
LTAENKGHFRFSKLDLIQFCTYIEY